MNPHMTDLDKDLVLAIVRYYMDQQLRRRIMLEAPHAYNNWMQREIVLVNTAE